MFIWEELRLHAAVFAARGVGVTHAHARTHTRTRTHTNTHTHTHTRTRARARAHRCRPLPAPCTRRHVRRHDPRGRRNDEVRQPVRLHRPWQPRAVRKVALADGGGRIPKIAQIWPAVAKVWPKIAFFGRKLPKFVPKVLPPSYALNKVYAPFEVYTILHLGLQTDPGAIGQCFA